MNALEDRLARLDLQLAPSGDHLSEDAIAGIAQGFEPTAREAAHLAGCDECADLLVATGAGLEAALVDLPGAEQWAQPSARPPATGSSLSLVLGSGALVVATAALWIALGGRDAPPAAIAPPAIVAVSQSSSQASQVLAEPAPDRRATPAVTRPTPAEAQVPSDAAPVAPTSEARPQVPRAVRRPTSDRPDTQMRARGPQVFEGRPVDGPPRGSGYLRLNSKPPAKVYLDGRLIGWTPLLDHRLLEGPHDVRLVYDSPRARLKEERFRVVIEPDRIWRSLRRNLAR